MKRLECIFRKLFDWIYADENNETLVRICWFTVVFVLMGYIIADVVMHLMGL